MKKILIAILMAFSVVALAYDSCPCPDGDPGHVDHYQTETASLCVYKKYTTEKKSLSQAESECANQTDSQAGAGKLKASH
jgi:hypothetical protein